MRKKKRTQQVRKTEWTVSINCDDCRELCMVLLRNADCGPIVIDGVQVSIPRRYKKKAKSLMLAIGYDFSRGDDRVIRPFGPKHKVWEKYIVPSMDELDQMELLRLPGGSVH